MNHIETMLKKARELKTNFSETPISVVIPDSSSYSCGTTISPDYLLSSLESTDGIEIRTLNGEKVTVPQSGYGDHYVEFSSGARVAGEKQTTGIEIVLL